MKRIRDYLRLGTVLCLLLWSSGEDLFAQWSANTVMNLPVCTSGRESPPGAVTDGAGGAIFVWADSNAFRLGVYAQRIDARGGALWTKNGVAVSGAAAGSDPILVSDEEGGAIVAWYDPRPSAPEGQRSIYVQRLNANGEAVWNAGGLAIGGPGLGGTGYYAGMSAVSDEAHGIIVAWSTSLSPSTTGLDIFAQRVNATGIAQWTVGGSPICRATGNQTNPAMASDGRGGALVTWLDPRASTTSPAIYAQRISLSGSVQWAVDGIAICGQSGSKESISIVSDPLGSAIIAWIDGRILNSSDLYAQRVNASGILQWKTEGVPVCTAMGSQTVPTMISDGTNGAILAWQDGRQPGNAASVYVQRVNVFGEVQWTMNGVPVYVGLFPLGGVSPSLVADGQEGAIIVWTRNQSYLYPPVPPPEDDLYAQHISGAGEAEWGSGGVTVSTAAGAQRKATVTSDGFGGIIVGWQDTRTYSGTDIYAQRVGRRGEPAPRPTILSVSDVPRDQGGKVYLTWQAADLDTLGCRVISHYSIWRAIRASVPYSAEYTPLSAIGVEFSGHAYRQMELNGTLYNWEWLVNQPAHYLSTYAYTASTLNDSMAGSTGKHYFLVSTHTSDPNIFWDSAPDSGYSVDNLPPAVPRNLAAKFVAGTVLLHWSPSLDPDLGGYEVYRSTKPQFNPDTTRVYAAMRDTTYTDAAVGSTVNLYYAVRSIDIHGNQSAKSNEASVIFVGVEEPNAMPTEYALAQNYPNPFNPSTTIRYALPAQSHVTLTIYNTLGEIVKELVNGEMDAGYHEVIFDASHLSSGVYLYRIEAGTFVNVKKLVVLR
jgi:hypothetical protein